MVPVDSKPESRLDSGAELGVVHASASHLDKFAYIAASDSDTVGLVPDSTCRFLTA